MADDLYDNELVQKLLKRAQEHLQTEAATNLDMFATFAYSPGVPGFYDTTPCESQLEAGFEIWWQAISQVAHLDWNPAEFHFVLERQAPADCGGRQYRLDFRVVPDRADPHIGTAAQGQLGVPLPCIGVELDGHEFHEKTKEQASYRNQRDRDLQRAGWLLFHFSGSEFVRHPQRCVEEVYRAAQVTYVDFAGALIRARGSSGLS